VKKFLKAKGGADLYESLEIKWISGRKPVLILYEGDQETERIDLAPYSTSELHDLVLEKGFVLKSDSNPSKEEIEDTGPSIQKEISAVKRIVKEKKEVLPLNIAVSAQPKIDLQAELNGPEVLEVSSEVSVSNSLVYITLLLILLVAMLYAVDVKYDKKYSRRLKTCTNRRRKKYARKAVI